MYMIIKNILYYQKETIDRVEMHFIEKEPGSLFWHAVYETGKAY